MKGVCKDCLFLAQEWMVVVEKPEEIVLDIYCSLCGIFKKPDGYCDCYEDK